MTLLLLSALLTQDALAYSSGKTGSSTTGCTTCHGSSASSGTTVAFSTSSSTVEPGDSVTVTFSVSHSTNSKAGLDVSASTGTLAAGSNNQLSSKEITHKSATAMSSGKASFSFTWTAPSSETTATLYGAGNAVNGNGGNSGDFWNTTSTTITVAYSDDDGDGYDEGDGDCDDADNTVSPGATETCDSVDENCDGTVDNITSGGTTYYKDGDSDGYGLSTSTKAACSLPSGYVTNDDDCDDGDKTVNPAASEVCGGGDEDCSGSVDDNAVDELTWYLDTDGDGYGDASISTTDCDLPSGYADNDQDCDDGDSSRNPGATELCTDAVDLNCDGSIAYADDDLDGWAACEECDDGNGGINPDAAEVVNDGIDQDCDLVDLCYEDLDGDDVGTVVEVPGTTLSCATSEGASDRSDDCDDGNALRAPTLSEIWYDGTDNDCDGNDSDQDLDGYAATEVGGDDCNDTDKTVNSAAEETWYDGVDADCSGGSDYDQDGDGLDALDHAGLDCDDEDATVGECPEDSDPQDSDPQDSDPQDSDPQDSDPQDSDPQDSDPQDSDPGDDSDAPDDDGDDEGEEEKGCGKKGAAAIALGFAGLALRRRRR